MASTTAAAAAVLFLLTLSTSSVAASKVKFNVTEMLSEFPEFSTFNNLMSQTKLADEINQRQTITVLVVDNGAAGAITSLPADTQKKVLAAQVILDYYDPVKLDGIKDKAAQLTTLFQASGAAAGQSGFLSYKEGADDQMAFGSAEPGAPLASKLVKVVASRPYNISVMQISAPIVPPSIGKGGAPSPTAAKGNNASSPALAPSKKPEEAPKEASAPTAEDGEASAPSSEDGSAPAAEEPSPAVAESPSDEDSAASSPPEPEKSTDATADAPTSAGSRAVAGASVGLIGLIMWMII